MHQLLEQNKMKSTNSLKFRCGSGGIKPMADSEQIFKLSTLKNYVSKVTETHQLNEEFKKDQSFRKRIIRVSASAAPTDRSNSPKHSNFQLGNLKTTDSDTQILVSRRFSSYVRN